MVPCGTESSADNTLTTLHNTLMYLNNRYNAPPQINTYRLSYR